MLVKFKEFYAKKRELYAILNTKKSDRKNLILKFLKNAQIYKNASQSISREINRFNKNKQLVCSL